MINKYLFGLCAGIFVGVLTVLFVIGVGLAIQAFGGIAAIVTLLILVCGGAGMLCMRDVPTTQYRKWWK